jgi:hypothetical protein
MKRVGVIFAGLTALAVVAGASAANAQQVRARPAQAATPAPDAYAVQTARNAQQPNQINPQTRRSTLRWDSVRGRWGLQLDMDQSAQRDLQWRDVQAGAYYSVTRQLRVGGSVGVAGQDALTRRDTTPPPAPRVRLETAFRF